jgi:hypothetical protein
MASVHSNAEGGRGNERQGMSMCGGGGGGGGGEDTMKF